MTILFMRQFPTKLVDKNSKRLSNKSIQDSKGAEINYRGEQVIFFFPGYGTKQRQLDQSIIERINSGDITDIMDVGGCGALSPEMKQGDFVISTGDIAVDKKPLTTKRNAKAIAALKKVAKHHNRAITETQILTTTKVIDTRKKRLTLWEKTKSPAVQMEHYWFLEQIKSRCTPEAFKKLKVTHMEIIIDGVPTSNSPLESILGILNAIDKIVIRNQKFIGRFKIEFLQTYLEAKRSL